MRRTWLGLLLLVGCGDDLLGASASPQTLREQLATETALVVSPPDSAGGITAERRGSSGWEAGFVQLGITAGDVGVLAEPSGALLVQQLDLELAPIALPPTVLHDATLTDIRVTLAAPTRVPATWLDDNSGRASAALQLELSWSLVIDGVESPIGAPHLPAIPIELQLFSGDAIHAEIKAVSFGTLWNWADLVRLEDLQLTLHASSDPS